MAETPSAEPQAAKPHHRWRADRPGPGADQTAGTAESIGARQRKLIAGLAVAFLLIGAITGLVYWLRPVPRPYAVPIFMTEYESRLIPPIPHAIHDRDALRRYFPNASVSAPLAQEGHQVVSELTALAARSQFESVVIYLNGYASTAQPGDILLAAADTRPDDPASWLSLRRTLELIKACPSRRKLIVLDVMQPLPDARLGILRTDVATHLADVLEAVPDSHRLTLLPCAPGQINHSSDELGRSIFSYYFEQALQGYADGYGAGRRDGVVTVRELAEFVRARVDRWTHVNRGAAQTAVLTGAGADFPLVALSHGKPEPKTELPTTPVFPPWLQTGWKLRDQWAAEDVHRLAPSLFRRLEFALLHAEAEWREGEALERVEQTLGFYTERLTERLTRIREGVAEPGPHSLALARAQGQKPNAALVASLKELLATVESETRELKPDKAADAQSKVIAEFLAKHKEKTPFQLGWGVMELIAEQVNLEPDAIRVLAAVLSANQPRPVFAETLMLNEVAELTRQMDAKAWPTATARRMIEASLLGERASAQLAAFPWLMQGLDAAAQSRHDGSALFHARGYAPLALADARLRDALRQYESLQAQGDTLERARLALDEAGVFLPNFTPYLERQPRFTDSWLNAINAAGMLHTHLDEPPAGRQPSDQLQPLLDQVRQQTEILHSALVELRRPFQADAVTSLIRRSQRQDADAAVYLEAEAILSTPFLKSGERLALWKAARALGARLHDGVAALDDDDDATEKLTPAGASAPVNLPRLDQDSANQAVQRARRSIALLQLAGLDAQDYEQLIALLQALVEKKPVASELPQLASRLRQTWAETIPAQMQREAVAARQARLAVVVSPADVAALRDDLELKLWINRRTGERSPYWEWLAERYRYLTRDPLFAPPAPATGQARRAAPPFYAQIAQRYAQRIAAPPEVFVEFTSAPMMVVPPALDVPASYRVEGRVHELRTTATPTPPSAKLPSNVPVRWLMADDDWLSIIRANTNAGAALTNTANLPVTGSVFAGDLSIELQPGAERRGSPRPRGFLLEAALDGRTYHSRIDIPPLPSSEPAEILLSADSKDASAPLGDLRLRPVKSPQPAYLFVRNASARMRKLAIQLSAPGLPVTGGIVEMKPDETRRIEFPPPQPSAASGGATAGNFFELGGPLTVRVTEADTGTLVGRRVIQIGVAVPAEYVQVPGIQFVPQGANPAEKNRLLVKLRAAASLGKLPCVAELVLPAKRIPGLLGVRDGVLKGEIPADGGDLLLWAEDLQFTPGADEDGFVYISIDSRERALRFRTTFAQTGAPTTPRPDFETDLRVRGTRYAPATATLNVDLETDSPPVGAWLEVALGDGREDSFRPALEQKVPNAQRRRVALNPGGSGGALLFEAGIQQDWSVALDAGRLLGRHTVRARLVDKDGNPLKTLYQDVVLDDSPPELVQFVELGPKVPRDVPFIVRASGIDPASGISEVNFYVGKPVDGKLPPSLTPMPAQPINSERTQWAARLPLGLEQKGPLDLIVVFTNGVGLSTLKAATVEIVETDPAKNAPGIVEGKVMEGSRAQAKMKVLLTDAKGVSREATTKDDGSFVFEGVIPGSYHVSSAKTVPAKVARKDVIVQPGKRVTVTLELFLK
jgi:hypothetical protein